MLFLFLSSLVEFSILPSLLKYYNTNTRNWH